jgi:hypothetical protein
VGVVVGTVVGGTGRERKVLSHGRRRIQVQPIDSVVENGVLLSRKSRRSEERWIVVLINLLITVVIQE